MNGNIYTVNKTRTAKILPTGGIFLLLNADSVYTVL